MDQHTIIFIFLHTRQDAVGAKVCLTDLAFTVQTG